MTTSQTWWPADLRSLRPIVHSHGVHSAGTTASVTVVVAGGRGQQRFAPLNSCRTTSASTSARLLCAISRSMAQDLVGRSDDPHGQRRPGDDGLQDLRLWAVGGRLGADHDVYWAPREMARRRQALLGRARAQNRWRPCRWAHLRQPEARTATPIRSRPRRTSAETFARMAMNDEETVALTPAVIPSA